MASSRKIITLCLCLMLVSFGVVVEAGKGMMGGLFGGGGGGKHGGGNEILETLLAAGILAMLLKNVGHGHSRSSGHSHSYGYGIGQGYGQGIGYGHGAYVDNRAALLGNQMLSPLAYGLHL